MEVAPYHAAMTSQAFFFFFLLIRGWWAQSFFMKLFIAFMPWFNEAYLMHAECILMTVSCHSVLKRSVIKRNTAMIAIVFLTEDCRISVYTNACFVCLIT